MRSRPLSVEASDAPATAQDFTLTLWTDDVGLAADADGAGIDRIGVDLERLGKRARQGTGPLWLSGHREAALPALRSVLDRASLFARTNPPHDRWEEEAERLLAAGVQVLMLPAFDGVADVERAVAVIAGRALLVPLVETAAAFAEAADIAAVPGISEVHFGLNDLALAFRMADRFAVLDDDRLAEATHAIHAAGVTVGVGGIGRHDDRTLPVAPDLVYAQYPRLRASAALVARSFLRGLPPGPDPLARAVDAARRRLRHWQDQPPEVLDAARTALAAAVQDGT